VQATPRKMYNDNDKLVQMALWQNKSQGDDDETWFSFAQNNTSTNY